jgi:NCAIR mutase (PurE)-related protein
MDRGRLRELLLSVQRGEMDPDEALEALAMLPFVETPHARIDTHRALRQGLPEVVYGPGKTPEQIVEVVREQRRIGADVLVTRIAPEVGRAVQSSLPGGEHEPQARLLWYGPQEVAAVGKGLVVVVSAGTSDAPVAAEAVGVARRFGNKVEMLHDVGVAGLHRLLASSQLLRAARVLIVVAGSRCRPAWATERRSADSPPCSACSTAVLRTCAW